MSKVRWAWFLGVSLLVIAFFTDATFRFASLDHYEPYYELGAQAGHWSVVILLTLVFFLIVKRAKWDTRSFLRWLGVVSLLFLPFTLLEVLKAMGPEQGDNPLVIVLFEFVQLLLMGTVMILVTNGRKKEEGLKKH